MADWARAQSPAAVEEILDRENKRMADNLASKVTRLKSLALDIDRDAEDQNRYLDSMDSDFTSMTGLLTGSVKRFSTMARSGRDNRKLLCGPMGRFWSVSRQLPIHQARPFDSEYHLTVGMLSYSHIPLQTALHAHPPFVPWALTAHLASPMFTQIEPQAQLDQWHLTRW
ncbi:BET1-like protein isoform X1 [Panthera tigris]|uniref:BET1-like protein isoform X1 n=2 Tax=Panthera tigris TaxID=9694 RepID=UPI001C6FC034|nr:BET1-like protein isoform X1 [Panthera tigris]